MTDDGTQAEWDNEVREARRNEQYEAYLALAHRRAQPWVQDEHGDWYHDCADDSDVTVNADGVRTCTECGARRAPDGSQPQPEVAVLEARTCSCCPVPRVVTQQWVHVIDATRAEVMP